MYGASGTTFGTPVIVFPLHGISQGVTGGTRLGNKIFIRHLWLRVELSQDTAISTDVTTADVTTNVFDRFARNIRFSVLERKTGPFSGPFDYWAAGASMATKITGYNLREDHLVRFDKVYKINEQELVGKAVTVPAAGVRYFPALNHRVFYYKFKIMKHYTYDLDADTVGNDWDLQLCWQCNADAVAEQMRVSIDGRVTYTDNS